MAGRRKLCSSSRRTHWQGAPTTTWQAGQEASLPAAQGTGGVLDQTTQHTKAVGQQRAVGRVVDRGTSVLSMRGLSPRVTLRLRTSSARVIVTLADDILEIFVALHRGQTKTSIPAASIRQRSAARGAASRRYNSSCWQILMGSTSVPYISSARASAVIRLR
jgi:hypothetical protein